MLKFNRLILAWLLADALPSAAQLTPRPSTASPQVQVLDTAFRLPQLQRTRRVWVYLPAGYATSRQRYPVLYLQDGQSVFDAAHATGRGGPVEWQVDETIDAARHPCIVVAVAADAAHRMQEYNPHATSQYGPGEGRQLDGWATRLLRRAILPRGIWVAGRVFALFLAGARPRPRD